MADAAPLPADVTATIRALLPPGTPGREELLRQLPHTTLGKGCPCGCATVDLEVDRTAAAPADVRGDTVLEAGCPGGGVLLFVQDGYLALLEIYSFLDAPLTTWPPPELLTV